MIQFFRSSALRNSRTGRVIGRYLLGHRDNLVCSFEQPRTLQATITHYLDDLIAQNQSKNPSATPSLTWDEAVIHYDWPPAYLRRRYREYAAVVRCVLPVAWASLGLGVFRLVVGDGYGLLAGLSAAILLFTLIMRPAYRCWSIRRRQLGAFPLFLGQPTAWWPPPLPDDYLP
ncbi:MAG: hypothetical protein HC808_14565 [Candidatus Competibacteraceae bacterium]|nr:hypothetical protein [Candidatus Competibacteraceae bacterium]